MKSHVQAYGRLYIALGVGAAYILAFRPLYSIVGILAGALVVMPIVAVGWLLGLRGGLLVGVLSLPLNAWLYVWVREPQADQYAPWWQAGRSG
jgi:thiamine transporter ThiT